MPPTHTDEGLRAALELRRDLPGTGVLVFSQYIETRYAARLLQGNAAGVGYLLKDRVADVAEFVDALARVGAGSTLDPEVVSQFLGAGRHAKGLAADPAGGGGVVADGRGPLQRRHRRCPGHLRRRGREARGQRLRQARPAPSKATTAASWPSSAYLGPGTT